MVPNEERTDEPSATLPLFDLLLDAAIVVDSKGLIRRVNPALVAQSGYSAEELIGSPATKFAPTWNPPAHKLTQSRTFALPMVHASGVRVPVIATVLPLNIDDGDWFVATMHASTSNIIDEAATDAERRFSLAFENSMAPMFLVGTDDLIVSVNDAFCEMLGYRRAELLGESFLKFTFDADVDLTIEMQQRMKNSLVDRVRFVKRCAHKGGHSVVAEVAVSAARDAAGAILYFIVSLRDITAERELTTRLEFQALHDPLTGLANRTLFADRFAAALERAKRTAGTGAVIMLDLDGFKEVNDTYGHLVGDDLLRQAAHRMSGAARGADTLCRFGGDEFLYLAENLTGPDDAALVADRLRCTFDAPFVVGSRELHVNVSVGLSCWDQFSTNQDVVVNAADNALYKVKLPGKERQVLVTT